MVVLLNADIFAESISRENLLATMQLELFAGDPLVDIRKDQGIPWHCL